MLYNEKKSTSVGSTHAQKRLVFGRISKTLYSIDKIESIYSLKITKIRHYVGELEMKNLKQTIRRTLFEIGAQPTSKGYGYAVEILCDCIIDETPIVNGCKLYSNWAPKFKDTASGVERALRYLKDKCHLEDNRKFRSIFGHLEKDLGIYDFLEMLRFYITDEMEEV